MKYFEPMLVSQVRSRSAVLLTVGCWNGLLATQEIPAFETLRMAVVMLLGVLAYQDASVCFFLIQMNLGVDDQRMNVCFVEPELVEGLGMPHEDRRLLVRLNIDQSGPTGCWRVILSWMLNVKQMDRDSCPVGSSSSKLETDCLSVRAMVLGVAYPSICVSIHQNSLSSCAPPRLGERCVEPVQRPL
jgi:hypothetical protein